MEHGYYQNGGEINSIGDNRGVYVERQRSMVTNVLSLRTTSTGSSTSSMLMSQSPHLSRAPYSPQLDGLINANGGRPASSQRSSSNDSYNAGASPSHNPNLRSVPSEASRLRALNNSHSPQQAGNRQIYEGPQPENFSRPRNLSLKRNNDPRPILHNSSTFPLQTPPESMKNAIPGPRDRGLSTSSSMSTNVYQNIPLRPSTSIPDYFTADSVVPRQRNFIGLSSYRVGSDSSDSYVANHRREPLNTPSRVDGEEIRASFRSALTASSSYFGTSGTERSSIMTKSSSATSIFGRDEGMSVDDAIGMYEAGFADSGAEDDDEPRPASAFSHRSGQVRIPEPRSDFLPLPSFSNLIIRDSTAFFDDPDSLKPLDNSQNGESTPMAFQYPQSLKSPNTLSRTGSRPVTRAQPQTFDDTRDRYGFRKKSQHVSLEEFENWNRVYTEHLDRRRKKWVGLMKETGFSSDQPVSFPPKSTKVKRFVRKGIPPDWRGAAWFWYAGGPAMLAKHPGLYDELLQKAANGELSATDEELIERDLNRTFPDNVRFKPDPVAPQNDGSNRSGSRSTIEPETEILQSLRRVLQVFSIYNPKIGYCQSLNFLAGLLLLFMEEEKSFWVLNIITRVYLPGTHEVNLEGANVDLGVLMTSVKESMPPIWAKIGGELDGSAGDGKVSMRLPPITLCCTAWFMSCFIGTLPIESTLRVWDSFFYEGSKTLFRIALAIFKVGEVEIRAVSDPMEIFQVVQTIPRRLIDASALMEACFKRRNGFGHLSQDTIEARRAERRAGYADERAKAAGQAPTRKNTIFLRRRGRQRTMEP